MPAVKCIYKLEVNHHCRQPAEPTAAAVHLLDGHTSEVSLKLLGSPFPAARLLYLSRAATGCRHLCCRLSPFVASGLPGSCCDTSQARNAGTALFARPPFRCTALHTTPRYNHNYYSYDDKSSQYLPYTSSESSIRRQNQACTAEQTLIVRCLRTQFCFIVHVLRKAVVACQRSWWRTLCTRLLQRFLVEEAADPEAECVLRPLLSGPR